MQFYAMKKYFIEYLNLIILVIAFISKLFMNENNESYLYLCKIKN
jgi:hypothetical protein